MSAPFADRLDDRAAGRLMVGVAAAGVVVALVGAIVGWNLVGHLDSAAGDTLAVTEQALVTIEETVAVADEVVASTLDALVAVEAALDEVGDTTDSALPVLESLARLGEEVAPNLESATGTLRSLADGAEVVDRVLGTLGRIPGTPAYDPDTPLAEQFTRLADDIAPVADTLREVSDELGPALDDTDDLRQRLTDLQIAVGGVRVDLARSDALLSDYATTAEEARGLAQRTSRDLSGDVTTARLLVLAAALVFAGSQLVPYWYGRELIGRAARRDDEDEVEVVVVDMVDVEDEIDEDEIGEDEG
jgi:hypothetical protein